MITGGYYTATWKHDDENGTTATLEIDLHIGDSHPSTRDEPGYSDDITITGYTLTDYKAINENGTVIGIFDLSGQSLGIVADQIIDKDRERIIEHVIDLIHNS